MIYELTTKGDIEWTAIETRKCISREALLDFTKQNTHRGYASVRSLHRLKSHQLNTQSDGSSAGIVAVLHVSPAIDT